MKNDEYATKDLHLGACLLASDIPLSRLEKISHKSFSFVFDTSPQKAEEIISDHWNRKLIIPSRDLIDALSELKTRMFNQS